MAKIKKLGAFGGVFVPSILTILGVIMYMRLPWIVGQAGLYATLGIIFVAHIISISTGLSISSIATDKKVEAGGTYYMISRSMGLPIGGTLGLALFVGLSFSVSLYLIGFSEAFLSFFDMDTSINSIRFTGFIVLSCVALITFISTKLAIKTQYFILTAMVLSLISIFLGVHDFKPVSPNFFGTGEALPWIVLFGIFFPAVTGFEAGVSMSGDLSNPKKAIPRGTIAAISIGLIVYLFLAFFFSYTVSGEQLHKNPNVLFDISRISHLVVFGIWGATLSSALGSILAAPRILQAISVDKITPRFFAKGYGGLNEPRHALILTFFIALSGIMIGELNAIARIVTIFFIITYGFLNLSCFIESWASSDFRPSFKISPLISIVGAIACFIVMIQLDFLAMIGATLVLSGIFFYLKRKELVLRTGDAWNSVWASIVKSGLLRLKNNELKTRNWRPNIILFSGGIKSRPYLLEIGAELIGKLGILTDFELVEDEKAGQIISKSKYKEDILKTDYENNIFRKKYHCTNIYKGIESIAQLYGFSGIEPNAILLGFPNDPSKHNELLSIYKIFEKLNYNSIFIKYNKTKKFGQKKSIHLWWDGETNNLFFGISLLRFLTSGFKWRQAKCELHFINNHNMPEENIYLNLKTILSEYRISLEVVIHNNIIEKKSTLDYIKTESQFTDLIICDLPDASSKNIPDFFKALQKDTEDSPTIMLLNANNDFEEAPLFAKKTKSYLSSNSALSDAITRMELQELPQSKDMLLNTHLNDLKGNLEKTLFDFYSNLFVKVQERNLFITKELRNTIDTSFKSFSKNFASNTPELRKKEFYKTWNDVLFKLKTLSQELLNKELSNDKVQWEKAISKLKEDFEKISHTLPENINLSFTKSDYEIEKADNFKTLLKKLYKRISLRNENALSAEKPPVRKTINSILIPRLLAHIESILIKHQNNSYTSIIEFRKIVEQFKNTFYSIELDLSSNKLDKDLLLNYLNDLFATVDQNEKNFEKGIRLYKKSIFTFFRREMSKLILRLDKPYFYSYYKKHNFKKHKRLAIEKRLTIYPTLWLENTLYFAQHIYIDILLQSIASRIKTKINKSYFELFNVVKKNTVQNFEKIAQKIQTYNKQIIEKGNFNYDLDVIVFSEVHLTEILEDLYADLKFLTDDIPESLIIAEPEFTEHTEKDNLSEIPTISLPVRSNIEKLIESVLHENLNNVINNLNTDINKKFNKLNNLLNLSRYNIDNIFINDNLSEENERKIKLKYIIELGESFEKEKKSFFEIIDSFSVKLSLELKETLAPLSLKYLQSTPGTYKHSLQSRKDKKQFKPYAVTKKQIQKILEGLLYGRSRGILFAKSIQTEQTDNKSAMYHLLKLAEDNTPHNRIIEKLPFYYKNLFNNKFTVNQKFWVGRKTELKEAAIALSHYKNGSKGGLMILGERNSGKTSLSNFIAQLHFPKDNTYHVYPLRQGSCNITDFDKALSDATGLQGSSEEIMHRIPYNTCIVINDLALWWERSEIGIAVIKHIVSLINTFGHKCLFIINANTYSYNFINKLLSLNDYFVAIIRCEPFSTYELRDLILKRHQSGELKFKYGNLPESLMLEWRYAQLFNQYFNYADGVIGTALNAWLTNIKSIKNKEIVISKPQRFELETFDVLDNNKLVILTQFVLHRRLNKERLLRILNVDVAELDNSLHFLTAAQLLIKLSKDIYMLNSFLEPHLVKYLINKEIIK